jgi:hypothetical protein
MILDNLAPDVSLVPLEDVLSKVGWPDPVKLTALKKHKLTVIDLTQEPHDSDYVEWLNECLAEFHVKYVLLSPNETDHLVNEHTVYYNPDQTDYTQKYLPDLEKCINTLS